jgi:hypothetical protein
MEHRTRIVAPIFDQGTDYAFTSLLSLQGQRGGQRSKKRSGDYLPFANDSAYDPLRGQICARDNAKIEARLLATA